MRQHRGRPETWEEWAVKEKQWWEVTSDQTIEKWPICICCTSDFYKRTYCICKFPHPEIQLANILKTWTKRLKNIDILCVNPLICCHGAFRPFINSTLNPLWSMLSCTTENKTGYKKLNNILPLEDIVWNLYVFWGGGVQSLLIFIRYFIHYQLYILVSFYTEGHICFPRILCLMLFYLVH